MEKQAAIGARQRHASGNAGQAIQEDGGAGIGAAMRRSATCRRVGATLVGACCRQSRCANRATTRVAPTTLNDLPFRLPRDASSADASGPNSPWGASWGPREPPRTGTLGRPDAEREPKASASRSLAYEIATVGRAPNCDGKGLPA